MWLWKAVSRTPPAAASPRLYSTAIKRRTIFSRASSQSGCSFKQGISSNSVPPAARKLSRPRRPISSSVSRQSMLIEQQIAERRERARGTVIEVLERPAGGLYGDYRVKSPSGRTYRAAMRGPGLFENFCSCPDFAVNTLGTCKHIEALLFRLRQRHGKALE